MSAEKGYLREFGNLVFHFALLALLVSIAVGKLYGYEGTRILVADGEQGMCNTSTAVYDSFRAGNLVDGTDLSRFCFRVDDFSATFLRADSRTCTTRPSAMPQATRCATRRVDHDVGEGQRAAARGGRPRVRAGQRFRADVHRDLPQRREAHADHAVRARRAADDAVVGCDAFDTPALIRADERRKNQIALEGLFAPDALYHGTLLTSASPEPRDPAVAIRIFKGDTGLDTGKPQNVDPLDQDLIEQGRLQREAQVNLAVGQSHTLADGTTVTFDGYQRWVSVQVSHDPAQIWVLVSAVVMLGGLLVSLLVRRRRIWARLVPAPAGESAGQAGRP